MGLASQAARVSGQVASQYGGDASAVGGTIAQYAQRQLANPSGYSPQDLTAQLVASQAGGGGATSAIAGNLNQTAAATNNYGGFAGSADLLARQQLKAAAGGAESIAAGNADVKLKQQQQASGILGNLYSTDVNAQGNAMQNQTANDAQANQEGFFGRLAQISGMLQGGASAAAGLGVKVR